MTSDFMSHSACSKQKIEEKKREERITSQANLQGQQTNYQTSVCLFYCTSQVQTYIVTRMWPFFQNSKLSLSRFDQQSTRPPSSLPAPFLIGPTHKILGRILEKLGTKKGHANRVNAKAPVLCPRFQYQQPGRRGLKGDDHLFQQPSESPVVRGFQRTKEKKRGQKEALNKIW